MLLQWPVWAVVICLIPGIAWGPVWHLSRDRLGPWGAVAVTSFLRLALALVACGFVFSRFGLTTAREFATWLLWVYPLFLACETLFAVWSVKGTTEGPGGTRRVRGQPAGATSGPS